MAQQDDDSRASLGSSSLDPRPLLGDDESWHLEKGYDKRGRSPGALSRVRQHLLLTATLLVSMAQWVLILWLWQEGISSGVPLSEAHGLVPEFDTKVVRFNSTREDGARAMDDMDPSWVDVMPVGSGFVVVDGWDRYQDQLPPPMQLEGQHIFSVAVFHQIHCLHYMLKEFNKLVEPNRTHHSESQEQAHGGHHHASEDRDEALKHVGHCFDYLRNSLMCCGDVAFEGQGSDFDEAGTLGEGSYHVCKDYDKIKSWAEGSRFNSMEGFSD